MLDHLSHLNLHIPKLSTFAMTTPIGSVYDIYIYIYRHLTQIYGKI